MLPYKLTQILHVISIFEMQLLFNRHFLSFLAEQYTLRKAYFAKKPSNMFSHKMFFFLNHFTHHRVDYDRLASTSWPKLDLAIVKYQMPNGRYVPGHDNKMNNLYGICWKENKMTSRCLHNLMFIPDRRTVSFRSTKLL